MQRLGFPHREHGADAVATAPADGADAPDAILGRLVEELALDVAGFEEREIILERFDPGGERFIMMAPPAST